METAWSIPRCSRNFSTWRCTNSNSPYLSRTAKITWKTFFLLCARYMVLRSMTMPVLPLHDNGWQERGYVTISSQHIYSFGFFQSEVMRGTPYLLAKVTIILSAGALWKLPGNLLLSIASNGIIWQRLRLQCFPSSVLIEGLLQLKSWVRKRLLVLRKKQRQN